MKESYVKGLATHNGPESCGDATLVSVAATAEPEDAGYVGADVPLDRPVVATAANPSPLSLEAAWRHYLRQEPDALAALVRICGGGD